MTGKVALGELMALRTRSVDPRKSPDEIFELYSIPAFDAGAPVVTQGQDVGSPKQAVEPGDVLLSKIVPHIRRAWVVPPDAGARAIGSSEWIVFRSERFHPPYLRHVLVSDRFHVAFMGTVAGVGGSLLRARPTHVSNIKIPFPPIEEQRRIAAVLDQADKLRVKRHVSFALLDSLNESIFLDMFGEPSGNPRGWPTAPLEDLCTIAGEYGASVPSTPSRPDRPRYVRITDIGADGRLAGEAVAPAGSSDRWRRFELRVGDVLFARSGATVGKTYLHRDSGGPHVFAGYLIRFRPDPTVLNPSFLYGFTRTSAYRRWVQNRQRAVAQPNVNAKQYGSELIVPLPPVALQRDFAQRSEDIQRHRLAMTCSLARLDELLSSLQDRAFAGQL
jgi:type I restriction enzyme S subunit